MLDACLEQFLTMPNENCSSITFTITGQSMWQLYALLAAFFAGLTAIFSKLGLKEVDAGLALAIRVTFILAAAWLMVFVGGSVKGIKSLSLATWFFMALPPWPPALPAVLF